MVRRWRSIGDRGHWESDAKDMLYFQQRFARDQPCAELGEHHAWKGCARSPDIAWWPGFRHRSISIPSQRSDAIGLHAHGIRGCVGIYAATNGESNGSHWQALTVQAQTIGQLDTSWHETQVDPGDVPHNVLLECMEQDAAAQEQLVAVIGIMLEETLRINSIGMTSASSIPIREKTMFEEAVNEGTYQYITGRAFVARIRKISECSASSFVVGAIYLERLRQHDESVMLSMGTFRRLFLVSVMLAAKFLDDQHVSNRQWARIIDIAPRELKKLEVEFLCKIGFSLMVTREEYEWYSEELRDRLETERAAGRSCDIADEEKPKVIWRDAEREARPFLGTAPLQWNRRKETHLYTSDRSDLLQPDISELTGGVREDSWWQIAQRGTMLAPCDRVICCGIQVGAEVEPVCHGPASQPLSGTQNVSLATGPLSAASWVCAQHSLDGPWSNRRSLRSSDVSSMRDTRASPGDTSPLLVQRSDSAETDTRPSLSRSLEIKFMPVKSCSPFESDPSTLSSESTPPSKRDLAVGRWSDNEQQMLQFEADQEDTGVFSYAMALEMKELKFGSEAESEDLGECGESLKSFLNSLRTSLCKAESHLGVTKEKDVSNPASGHDLHDAEKHGTGRCHSVDCLALRDFGGAEGCEPLTTSTNFLVRLTGMDSGSSPSSIIPTAYPYQYSTDSISSVVPLPNFQSGHNLTMAPCVPWVIPCANGRIRSAPVECVL